MASFGSDISEQSVKVFSTKILFPPNCKSFPPRTVIEDLDSQGCTVLGQERMMTSFVLRREKEELVTAKNSKQAESLDSVY